MGAMTAEIQLDISEAFVERSSEPVLVVPKLAGDVWSRKKAEKIIRSAGSVALGDHSESREQRASGEYATLADAIDAASLGEASARQSVKMNVKTDVVERTIKAGHVMRVGYSATESGKIQQYGQYMDDVYTNSLCYVSDMPSMRARAEAETRNGSRIEDYYRRGFLDDYCFVVISRCADYMSEKEMEKAGFFTDTMSCALQVTTVEDGELTTESAFVAGVSEPGDVRHDAQTIVRLGQSLGVDFEGKSSVEIIDTPLLVRKNQMKNGVIDLVQRYDEAAGGTFFGESKPHQDYQKYAQTCRNREMKLEPIVDDIVDTLLSETDSFSTPLDATRRLHVLSQHSMVDEAIRDPSIDSRVFGRQSAVYINEARQHYSQGYIDQVEQARGKAQLTAVSSSCPNGGSSTSKSDTIFGENNFLGDNPLFPKTDEDKYGSLEFTCRKGHANTRPRNKLIERCKTCKESVRC
ncbi:hypothetical protein BH23PAT2_BH23PAT2_04880 [soil metagenome]